MGIAVLFFGKIHRVGFLNRVCESVASNLVGKRLESFTRISSAVRKAVEEALTRILTPRRSIDVMREVKVSKAKGKPYTIVFVGVNGVGKSTNLSKVAYWLLQNGMKVRFKNLHRLTNIDGHAFHLSHLLLLLCNFKHAVSNLFLPASATDFWISSDEATNPFSFSDRQFPHGFWKLNGFLSKRKPLCFFKLDLSLC